MTKSELLIELDRLMQLRSGTLTGTEDLESLGWDSIAVLEFIALMSSVAKKRVAGKDVTACKTVSDLLVLAGMAG